MYACAWCKEPSIDFVRKWLSWSSAPASCKRCGAGSAIAVVDASGILVAAAAIITVAGFTAAALSSVLPLLAGVALAVSFYFWRQHKAPLLPVTPEEHRNSKLSGWAMVVAFLMSVLS